MSCFLIGSYVTWNVCVGIDVFGILQLEKALRGMHEEYTRTKLASEAKLADANALIDSVEDKSLVTDERFLAAEAKLAEANKKSLEVERRLQEVETRESVLRREQASLSTEYALYSVNILHLGCADY